MMDVGSTQPSRAVSEPPSDSLPQNGEKAQKRRPSRNLVIGCLILTILAAGLLVVALPIATYAYYQINGLIVPGVRVGGLELGGLTWADAKDGLKVVYPQEIEIWVTDGTRTWKGKASDFGVGWDTEAMAHEALNVAHGKDLSSELSEMSKSLIEGWELEPKLAFDIEAARIELLKWEPTVNVPARNAELRVHNGEVEVIPPETGLSLDVEATLSGLSNDPGGLIESGVLLLTVRSQEPEITDVSRIQNQVEEMLAAKVVVQAYDPVEDAHYEWEVDREKIASWLILPASSDNADVLIDTEAVRSYGEGLDSSLGSVRYLETEEVKDAILNGIHGDPAPILRIYYSSTKYVVQPGDTLLEIGWELGFPFWMIMDANPFLYSSPLEYGQELVIPSRDTLVPLPVIPDKRIVISITDQRLRTYQDGELLWEFIASTGIEDSPTQPGVFQVRTHELNAYASVWDLYMPHFLGVYEAWPEFMNGIHGLPMLSSGRRLWANVLGRPASYGCIILTLEDAETLYKWAEDGVVVEILE
jgi:hypothetical protein